ncbi:MAG: hypothetical protein AABX32_05080 [Nanoarchaeota archaeon]
MGEMTNLLKGDSATPHSSPPGLPSPLSIDEIIGGFEIEINLKELGLRYVSGKYPSSPITGNILQTLNWGPDDGYTAIVQAYGSQERGLTAVFLNLGLAC